MGDGKHEAIEQEQRKNIIPTETGENNASVQKI